ncbi:MAG: hypothetical protein GY798_11105, partial [Hyphomicrobiales bacterium]|nr:hypothetical protein [Hyphomicrobiales bacterium]
MTLNRNTSLAIALLLAPALSLAAAAAAHAAEGTPSDVASEVASDFGPEIVTDRPADMARRVENRGRVIRFLENGDYLHWPHDPHTRPTGDLHQTPEGKLISGMTHHRVRVYYSPDVAEWLRDGRPADAVLP